MTTTKQKRKKPTAFDALKYVNDRVTKLESEQIGTEQAFKVCNEAIDELRADMDKVDGRLDQFDLDLKAICKSVTAMGNDINRISAGLEALRHHTTEKPALPRHMEAVSEQTFGHGDVFEHSLSGSTRRLVWLGADPIYDGDQQRVFWGMDHGSSLFLLSCNQNNRLTFEQIGLGSAWRHVPSSPSERV